MVRNSNILSFITHAGHHWSQISKSGHSWSHMFQMQQQNMLYPSPPNRLLSASPSGGGCIAVDADNAADAYATQQQQQVRFAVCCKRGSTFIIASSVSISISAKFSRVSPVLTLFSSAPPSMRIWTTSLCS